MEDSPMTDNAYFEQAVTAIREEGVSKDAQAISLSMLAVAEEINITRVEGAKKRPGKAAGF